MIDGAGLKWTIGFCKTSHRDCDAYVDVNQLVEIFLS